MQRKPSKVKVLEELARDTIGDGKRPDLFFVSDQGVIVTVTRDYVTARDHFRTLANRRPLVECMLEARSYGVVADVSPISDEPNTPLEFWDAPNEWKGTV